jgi:ectoine hydroxylase-related dioxygenase (phytanoyl-CoA dioxygenase family)
MAAAFRTTGYAMLGRLFDDDILAAIDAEIDLLGELEGAHRVTRTAQGEVAVINGADATSDLFWDLLREPGMIALAERLLQTAVVPLHVEVFDKRAGSPARAAPHQDHVFYYDHFDVTEAIGIWLALDDVGPDNGAIEYAEPFRREMLPHRASEAVLAVRELLAPGDLRYRPASLQRGEAVAHSSFCIHRSAPNGSSRRRRAVAFNYRGSPYRQSLRAGYS